MLNFTARTWPWILARGIIAVLIGLVTMVWPGLTLAAVATFIGIWLIVDGVGLLINAFSIPGATGGERALFVIFAIISVVAGGVALANMNATLWALAVVLAVWFVASGIGQIAVGIRIRKQVTGEWLVILAGVIAILAGVFTMFAPGAALATATIIFGAFALVYGIFLIIAAVPLRGLTKTADTTV